MKYRQRTLVLASHRDVCEPCGGTGVMTLVRHWLDSDSPEPRQVQCPHCSWPWTPVSVYYQKPRSV